LICYLGSGKVLVPSDLINFSKPATPKVKVKAILVAHLPAALAAPILSPLDEPWCVDNK
jgi:hypothetical protein